MKMKVYMMIGLLLIFIACIGGEWIIDCIWNPPAKDTDASVPPEDKDSIHIQGEKQLLPEHPKKADDWKGKESNPSKPPKKNKIMRTKDVEKPPIWELPRYIHLTQPSTIDR